MSPLIDKITSAVEASVGAAVEHRESVAVLEILRGHTAWEGEVEVFTVNALPPTEAYGWVAESANGPQYVALKSEPLMDSPLAAVRVWLVSQARK